MTAENNQTEASLAERAEEGAAESERQLGRAMSIALPSLTVVATSAVGLLASAGPAILVVASGILLGAIALFWTSLRTLTGDAPLPRDLEHATFHGAADPRGARKAMLLRALRDLESERALGKIDEADFAALSSRFRDEIKQLMREMDDQLEPHIARAEELVKAHFVRVGLAGDPFRTLGQAAQATDEALAADDVLSSPWRLACSACGASNEPDARFCKACGAAVARPQAPQSSAHPPGPSTLSSDSSEPAAKPAGRTEPPSPTEAPSPTEPLPVPSPSKAHDEV